MEQTIYTLNRSEEPLYANFWTRVAATYIDTLILAPLAFGLVQYNLVYIKSFIFSLALAFIPITYKCFMEKKYGATFGKKIMKISVVSETLQKLTYQEVFIRNYYYFLGLIISFTAIYLIYAMPELQFAITFTEAWELKDRLPLPFKVINYVLSALMILDDLLMLNSDTNQTLHDRLGKTLVIKK